MAMPKFTPWKVRVTSAINIVRSASAWMSYALQNHVPIVLTTQYPTSTDGAKIYLNTEQGKDWTDAELAGVLVHELMHIWYRHIDRMKQWGKEHWERANCAADFAINTRITIDYKLMLPPKCLINVKWHHKSMEQIFYLLRNEMDKIKGMIGTVLVGDINPDAKPTDGKGKPLQMPSFASDKEMNKTLHKLAESIIQHGFSRKAGCTSGEFDEALAILNGGETLSWDDRLKQWCDSAANIGRSWSQPDRRYVHKGTYLPGKRSEEQAIEHLCLAIDISGSMNGAAVRAVGRVAQDILDTGIYKQVTILSFNTDIVSERTFARGDTIELPTNASGGTSIGCVLKWCAANRPTATVLLSDMQFSSYYSWSDEFGPFCWARYGVDEWPNLPGLRVQIPT